MKNDTLTTQSQVPSPFDSIRHFEEGGNEFWKARELMKLMGYTNWRRFSTPIEQAKENLALTGDDVSAHFLTLKSSTGGRTREDCKLTRYACYMVALCCDGRKVEVASAKKYFAVKAREAEVVVPAQSDRLRELELQKEILEAEAKLMATKRDYDNWSHMIIKTEGEEYLARLRGQLPPAPVVIEKQIPVDSQTGRPIKAGNLDCSVKSILKAAGLDEKTAKNKKVQERFKLLIKQRLGVDIQAGINTEVAYFANFYDVVPEDLRDEAIALAEQFKPQGGRGRQGNLFVHGLQQGGMILHPDFR